MPALTDNPTRIRATIPGDLDAMRQVRDLLSAALFEHGWSQEDRLRVLVCADEAMANAWRHANPAAGGFDVAFVVESGEASLTIANRCAPRARLDQPTQTDDTAENGRGMLLMDALADVFSAIHCRDRATVAMVIRSRREGTQ